MITVRNTRDINLNDGIKMMVYGAAGIGKTPLCATAPAPIILSAERGLLSIRQMAVPYIEIRNYRELYDSYQWCLSSHESRQYYTPCLDSLSEMAEVCLQAAKTSKKDNRAAFGDMIDNVVLIAKAFRDLPGKSVVVIAKEEYDKDEATGVMMFKPSMPGNKLGPKLPYLFDEVFRMTANPADRRQRGLNTVASFQHVARDRSGMLAEIEQPNLEHIFRKILQI